ncbi:hypothetical protein P879_00088 [Paragonimus westermani]|uniref:Uncharacterized protein n=1 Tax=Paragonimus westermani TaxID=34504 RepID=A0A8T0DV15_9TREM|nr:hypothetical protein P879_00088 [Paragonimus westermani]
MCMEATQPETGQQAECLPSNSAVYTAARQQNLDNISVERALSGPLTCAMCEAHLGESVFEHCSEHRRAAPSGHGRDGSYVDAGSASLARSRSSDER